MSTFDALSRQSSVVAKKQSEAGANTARGSPKSGISSIEEEPGKIEDSYQVQRARDIILRRVNDETCETESLGEPSKQSLYKDGEVESDVVSGILLGLDIDIDLPPSETAGGNEELPFTDLDGDASKVSETPFDEASSSVASSRDRPFDEMSGISRPLAQKRPINYPATVQNKMMTAFHDEDSSRRHQSFNQTQSSLSDLTSTVGRSSSSLIADDHPTNKARAIPSLLHNLKDYYTDESAPPPPPPPPRSLVPPMQIEAPPRRPGSVQTSSASHSLARRGQPRASSNYVEDPPKTTSPVSFPVQSLQRDPSSASETQAFVFESKSKSPVNESEENDFFATYDEDDDASSDPFEGYEDFDDDDMSEDEEVTPSYSGDSESEEGYTRFAKEDLTSEEDESVESNDRGSPSNKRRFGTGSPRKPFLGQKRESVALKDPASPENVGEDASYEARSEVVKLDPFVPADRVSTPVSTNAPVLQKEISPIVQVQEKKQPTSQPTKQREPSPSPKSSTKTTKGSPGNRIVKALSNSIRRRKKDKQNKDVFDALPQKDGEAGKQEASTGVDPLPSTRADRVVDKLHLLTVLDEDCVLEAGAPAEIIHFVSMPSPSYDDAMSQITFVADDYNGTKQHNKGNQWWGQLGLTTGKLDGWFPGSIVNQAVEAAEGFLSANAIHAQVKSQPLDFEEEEEEEEDDEEEDDVIQRNPSTVPVTALAQPGSGDVVLSCSDFRGSILFPPKQQATPISSPTNALLSSMNPALKANSFFEPDSPASFQPPPPDSTDINSVLACKGNTSSLEKEIERCEELLKQYERESENAEDHDEDEANRKMAATLHRLSILLIHNEKVDGALDATNEALRIQKSLGDTADACKSLHLLADIFVRKEEYESALSCYAEVQEMESKLYGRYVHEETANTLNRIGSVLTRQSKFALAMEKHQEALRILKECHGEDLRHPLVSQTLIHIGAVYYRERNSVATVRTNVDEYSTFIEVGMLEVIGRAHEDRGSYKMAISFFEEKLQFLNQKQKDTKTKEGKATLDDEATTLNSLGMLSCRAGVYMEAINYYERALEVQKQIGCCDKMHVATARVLTATVQFHLGYFTKALQMLQDALEDLQDETGDDHETVAATWFQLGVVQVALCEYDDGMDALEEALRIQNKLLGKLHPATLRTRREIGNMYAIYESELDAAFTQFNDILATQRRIHGHNHPNVAETLHSLGCAYARKGDFPNAIKTLEQCYHMRIDFLGRDHPLQATTLQEIAQIHMKRQRFRKAANICDAVLEIRKESLSERHIDVARAMAMKASCLVATGNYDGAMKTLMEAMPMAEQAVGPQHPAMADIYVHLGGMHLRKCHFDESKEWIQKALDIYQASNLDEDHPSLKEAIAMMERVDRDEMLCV